jgi:AraC family transcriptional regulator
MSIDSKWTIEVEKWDAIRTVYAYAFTKTPEEDAWKKIIEWAKPKGLLTKEKCVRVFGRNTYPTENPEPHGYELHITVDESIVAEDEIMKGEISGGLYAVLHSTTLEKMAEAWPSLWKWVEESEYEFTGWIKGKHGWVNGYEEYLNPFEEKPPNEWRFNLMIPLKKK